MYNMRRYQWWLVCLVATIALGIPFLLNYFIVVKPQNDALPERKAPTPTPVDTFENSIKLRLNAMNDSGVTGQVILDEAGGKAVVRVSLDGEQKVIGPPQPTYIHTGSCANLGENRHTLTLLVGGRSTTTLLFGINRFKTELPLAVTVSSSWSDEKNYIACADIVMK